MQGSPPPQLAPAGRGSERLPADQHFAGLGKGYEMGVGEFQRPRLKVFQAADTFFGIVEFNPDYPLKPTQPRNNGGNSVKPQKWRKTKRL